MSSRSEGCSHLYAGARQFRPCCRFQDNRQGSACSQLANTFVFPFVHQELGGPCLEEPDMAHHPTSSSRISEFELRTPFDTVDSFSTHAGYEWPCCANID